MADVKGDVTGMAQPGDDTEKVRERAAALGADGWEPRGCDVRLWDMLGGDGVPVRITISDMGPDLLARLLGLTDVQRGVLAIAFRMADDNGMLLIDLKDLRAMLGYLSEHASEVETLYGRVSSQSVGAIQRALLTLEDAGGDIFFGEPALDITDWLVTDDAGSGHREHPERRETHGIAPGVRHVSAVDAQRNLRASARGRRPSQT